MIQRFLWKMNKKGENMGIFDFKLKKPSEFTKGDWCLVGSGVLWLLGKMLDRVQDKVAEEELTEFVQDKVDKRLIEVGAIIEDK